MKKRWLKKLMWVGLGSVLVTSPIILSSCSVNSVVSSYENDSSVVEDNNNNNVDNNGDDSSEENVDGDAIGNNNGNNTENDVSASSEGIIDALLYVMLPVFGIGILLTLIGFWWHSKRH